MEKTAEQALKKFVFQFCEWSTRNGVWHKAFSHPPALSDRWNDFLQETNAKEEYASQQCAALKEELELAKDAIALHDAEYLTERAALKEENERLREAAFAAYDHLKDSQWSPEVELADKLQSALNPTEEILSIFKYLPHTWLSPWQVYDAFKGSIPITSIRARITVLEQNKCLIKSDSTVKSGPYNTPCYQWKFNPQSK